MHSLGSQDRRFLPDLLNDYTYWVYVDLPGRLCLC